LLLLVSLRALMNGYSIGILLATIPSCAYHFFGYKNDKSIYPVDKGKI